MVSPGLQGEPDRQAQMLLGPFCCVSSLCCHKLGSWRPGEWRKMNCEGKRWNKFPTLHSSLPFSPLSPLSQALKLLFFHFFNAAYFQALAPSVLILLDTLFQASPVTLESIWSCRTLQMELHNETTAYTARYTFTF